MILKYLSAIPFSKTPRGRSDVLDRIVYKRRILERRPFEREWMGFSGDNWLSLR